MVPKFSSTTQLNQTGSQRMKCNNTDCSRSLSVEIFLKECTALCIFVSLYMQRAASHCPVVSGCQKKILEGSDGAENIVRRNLGRPHWPQAGRGRVLAHYCTTALRGKTKPKRNITMPPTPPPVLMGFLVLVILRQGCKSEGRVKVKREGREGLLVASDSYPVHSVVLLILCISAAAARKTLNCESPLAS